MKPIFTTTAYSSFYDFFHHYAHVPAGTLVRSNLGLLNATIIDGWGYSFGLYSFITSRAVRNSTTILTDIGVNDGMLFDRSTGARLFDVVILGFTEYVTAAEYSSYRHFVATGGKLIFLSACNFIAEVGYNPAANRVTLVAGHGWVFDGSAAWKGPFHRWYAENSNWVGSNFALFYSQGYHINGAVANTSHPLSMLLRNAFGQQIFGSYKPHEENILTNSSNRVIAYWTASNMKHPGWVVAAYEHDYQKGIVIHMGVFGTDIIASDKQMQFLLLSSMGLSKPTTPSSTITTSTTSSSTRTTTSITSMSEVPDLSVHTLVAATAVVTLIFGAIYVSRKRLPSSLAA